MRPRTLDEVAGQRHILGPGKLLRRMLDADRLTSIILHGPPGTGKTTLAEVLAAHLNRHFERENASSVGVARIRQIIDEARSRLGDNGRRTVLFLDEIHRFSKSQQDVLLADVERGLITLIGATTENPLFAVNSALVSRSTLFRLEPLSEDDIIVVLRRAIADVDRGYGRLNLRVDDDALRVWAVKSDGDARRALTALEVAVLSAPSPRESGEQNHGLVPNPGRIAEPVGPAGGLPAGELLGQGSTPPGAAGHATQISRADAEESIQQKAAVYDASGDQHYDAASAMIKSVRGSDPDAAVYWIAYMLEAGEDPRFIARRLAILASEDIGNADPRGIMVAAATWELIERIGMPEARITLGQCATYLALAPKSNASYVAIEEALADVREGRTIPVPRHIKDGNVRKANDLSEGGAGSPRGDAYNYTHEGGIRSALLGRVGAQDYLGVAKEYYRPTDHGSEKLLKDRLAEAKRLRSEQTGRPA
jgi:putative ATPase